MPRLHRYLPISTRFTFQSSLGSRSRLLDGGAGGALGDTSLEAVLEAAGDVLEVAHAAGTDGLSPLGLLGPVVLAGLGRRVTAGGAGVLLDVKRSATATTAQGVRLVVSLTKRGGTLRCRKKQSSVHRNGEHALVATRTTVAAA